MDNYYAAKLKACGEFAELNTTEIADKNGLKTDEQYIYVHYLYTDYKIEKTTGMVYRIADESEADYSETLSIFDLLCHKGEKSFSGEFAPVNSLNNGPVSNGVPMKNCHFARQINKHPKSFSAACKVLGMEALPIGDIGIELDIYKGLKARLKFYESDDEFPASLTILFEKNMLQYTNYETVFYIAGDIERLILTKMQTI